MDNIADISPSGAEGQINEYFGCSVASAGDVNGDGYDDIIVGAKYFETNWGRAYLYYGNTGMNYYQAQIFNGQPNSYFGSSVACAGDINSDECDDVIIGSRGHVEVFYGGENISNYNKLSLAEPDSPDSYFGCSVASAGDIDSDGNGDIIVGAYGYDNNTGRVYIYKGLATPTITSQPEDKNVCAYSEAIFSITTSHVSGLSYWWQKSTDNGITFTNIPYSDINYQGITYKNLKVKNVTPSFNNYQYRCVISYMETQIYSEPGILTIETEQPVIETQSVSIELNETGVATLLSTQVLISATDNCAIIDTTLSQSVFNCENVGNNNINISVTDISGNTTTNTINVIVEDNIIPILEVQNISVQLNENGLAIINPALLVTNATDVCVTDTTLSKYTFSCEDIGEVEVLVTLIDAGGNTDIQTSIITVEDNLPPVFISQNLTIEIDSSGTAEISPVNILITAEDNCDIIDTLLSQSNFSCSDIGNNTIEITVKDNSNNSTMHEVLINVQDKIFPTIDCVTNQIVNADDATNTYTVKETEFDPANTWDNCNYTLSNNINNLQTLEGEIFELGNTNITWTIIDDFGNSTYCNFVVMINEYMTNEITANVTFGTPPTNFPTNEVLIKLYKITEDIGGNEVIVLEDELILGADGQVVFENLGVGDYYIGSFILYPENYNVAEHVFYQTALVYEEAISIPVAETTIFFADIHHPQFALQNGSNNAGGIVGELDGTKTLLPLSDMIVILRNEDLGEIIDVAVTNSNGEYSFDYIPDNTNIQMYVTSFEHQNWIPYSTTTTTNENITVDFVVDGDDVYPSGYVGVKENNFKNIFNIYPNPTNGIINIKFADINVQKLTISDITGKTIIEKSNIQQNEKIDLSSFESGIYIISIQTDKEIFTTKIVKE